MNLSDLPLRNLKHKPARTLSLLLIAFFLSLVVFTGSTFISSLQNGLERLEARLGADVMVIPVQAKRSINPKNMLLNGTPGYFYMPKSNMDRIAQLEGVDKVTPQLFLTTLSADCCSLPVQIIGFEPSTDFVIQPWIKESYGKELQHGELVAGALINAQVGGKVRFFNQDLKVVAKLDKTGTGLDTAVYANAETTRFLMEASKKYGLGTTFKETDLNNIISTVYVKLKPGYTPSKAANQINIRVRRVQGVPLKEMFSEIGNSLNGISRTVKILIGVVWLLTFLVLAISFSVVAGERKKEFAVLRLLGLSQSALAKLVLKEALYISAAGALGGIVLGALLTFAFSPLLESSLQLPFLLPSGSTFVKLGLLTLAITLLAGPLASAYAAHRVSKIDPAAIFREGN